MESSKLNGKVLIADGKINILEIREGDNALSEIQSIMALKNVLDEHIIEYEKNYKRH